jgi:hypothetical protein
LVSIIVESDVAAPVLVPAAPPVTMTLRLAGFGWPLPLMITPEFCAIAAPPSASTEPSA